LLLAGYSCEGKALRKKKIEKLLFKIYGGQADNHLDV